MASSSDEDNASDCAPATEKRKQALVGIALVRLWKRHATSLEKKFDIDMEAMRSLVDNVVAERDELAAQNAELKAQLLTWQRRGLRAGQRIGSLEETMEHCQWLVEQAEAAQAAAEAYALFRAAEAAAHCAAPVAASGSFVSAASSPASVLPTSDFASCVASIPASRPYPSFPSPPTAPFAPFAPAAPAAATFDERLEFGSESHWVDERAAHCAATGDPDVAAFFPTTSPNRRNAKTSNAFGVATCIKADVRGSVWIWVNASDDDDASSCSSSSSSCSSFSCSSSSCSSSSCSSTASDCPAVWTFVVKSVVCHSIARAAELQAAGVPYRTVAAAQREAEMAAAVNAASASRGGGALFLRPLQLAARPCGASAGGAGAYDTEVLIVTEYCSGGDVWEQMERAFRDLGRQQLDVDDMASQVAAAIGEDMRDMAGLMARVHELGFLLSDHKPDNVIWHHEQGLLLIDADGVERCEEAAYIPGGGIQTEGYAAPEQRAADGEAYRSHASDVYALGACAEELLASACCRLSGEAAELLRGMTGRLQAVARRCMAEQEAKRPTAEAAVLMLV